MAMGKEIGEFSFKVTSVSYAADGSTVSANLDGTATGFGTVLGSLIFKVTAPGTKCGTCSYRGAGYLDDGSEVAGTAEGVWHASGKHRWRIRGINLLSSGQLVTSDGELDLASRSYKGKLFDGD
jgi:hypothetical protein